MLNSNWTTYLRFAIMTMLASGASLSAATTVKATVSSAGAITLTLDKQEIAKIRPGLFEAEWRMAAMSDAAGKGSGDDGICRGTIKAPGGTLIDCEIRPVAIDGGLQVNYRLTPRKKIALNSLHVEMDFPLDVVIGRSWSLDDKSGSVPKTYGQAGLGNSAAKTIKMGFLDQTLQIELNRPVWSLIQDNRQWGPSLTIRIGESDLNWAAGKTLEFGMKLTTATGITVTLDKPVTITANADWVPLDLDLEIEAGSALDFSQMGQFDAPAGKNGRILAGAGGHFVAADKPTVPLRFYGVNLCFGAQFLSHEEADLIAERLMRLGYNTVRFHHYEGELIDSSNETTTTLKPDKQDQFDYLFAALKKRGIYATTDLFVSRPVRAREIYPDADPKERIAMDDFKMAIMANEQAFANWQAFARSLLSHQNVYTGTTLATDPAMAWLIMINEGNVGNFVGRIKGRVGKDWQRIWNEWLQKRYDSQDALKNAWQTDPGGSLADGAVPLSGNVYGDSPRDRDLVLFCADVEGRMFVRMKKFLRDELNCQALLSNCNAWTNRVTTQASRVNYDYVDDHFYIDHPHFLERDWSLPSRCPNSDPIAAGAPGGTSNAFLRLMDRPFTCSEFNYSGPGRYRGVGGILTGALGAIQDWDAIWRFAYSHGRDSELKPSRMDYFNLSGDPLNQAADRATICLYLRGDMKPATHSVAVAMPIAELTRTPVRNQSFTPPWTQLAWITRVGSHLDNGTDKVPADLVLPLGWGPESKQIKADALLNVDPYDKDTAAAIVTAMRDKGWLANNRTDLGARRYESEGGQIIIDAPQDTMTLNTPQTAGGYAPQGTTIKTAMLDVTITKTDATVWVSTLDAKPINQSSRLIITHLTDLQNSNSRFAETARETLLDWGKLPHLMHDGTATVAINLVNPANATVWAIATNGKRLNTIATTIANNRLVIPLAIRGPDGKAQMTYEIQIAPK